jgi:hypothetical protein
MPNRGLGPVALALNVYRLRPPTPSGPAGKVTPGGGGAPAAGEGSGGD